nr:MAG TPA: hypothetical protein [Siphoviridae sp. ctEfY6]
MANAKVQYFLNATKRKQSFLLRFSVISNID